MIVADASLLANLVVHRSQPNEANAVMARDAEWFAPPLWRFEMHSALLKYLRAGSIGEPEVEVIMAHASEVISHRERQAPSIEVLRVAMTYGTSSYDAEYLALARLLGVPLVTLDRKLVRASRGLALSPADFVR